VAWDIYLTDEVLTWLDRLLRDDVDSHRQVVYAIEALAEGGPNLGRPLVDRLRGSSLHNLKELRPGSAGGSEIRVLFMFDPWRSAILLIADGQGRELGRLVSDRDPPRGGAVRDLPEGTRRRGGHAMSNTRWSDIRHQHIAAAGGAEDIEAGKNRLLTQVRAHRLAEIRKRRGLTQRDVATAMGVTVGRVSQIEAGDISGIDVLDRYVTAIGGLLEIVANFGDEQLKIG
jgi:DNA-binding XRE family transcriptional regulator